MIYTASLACVSENVYYDCEFHLHMSRYPQHSWSVILQQAWNLCSKDWLTYSSFSKKPKHKVKDVCKHFNKGKCHSGASSCRYKHRCLNCGKFGHGSHICKRKSDRTENLNSALTPAVQETQRMPAANGNGHPAPQQ